MECSLCGNGGENEYIYTNPEIVIENIDWNEILKLSSEHKIVPMVYESVNKTEKFQSLEPEMKNVWKLPINYMKN